MKVCKECKVLKSLFEYFKTPNTFDGYLGKCITCTNIRKKAWSKRNKTQQSIINEKICKKCSKNQPIIEFHINSGNKDGYQNRCKTCSVAYDAKVHKENPGKAKAKAAKYRAIKINATLEGYDGELKEIYNNSPEGNEIHHIIPLQEFSSKISGLHVPWNLVSLSKEEHLKAHEELKRTFKILTD